MPWWIWPILVLFMLAMIAAGLVYAGLHGFHAVQDIAEIGGRLGERVSKMGEPGDSTEESEPPLFTQPLNVAQERYVDAHAEVIQRKNVTRERHIAAHSRKPINTEHRSRLVLPLHCRSILTISRPKPTTHWRPAAMCWSPHRPAQAKPW